MIDTSVKIKELLRSRRMRQAQLARLTGISSPALNNYIKGRRTPDIETLERIAVALEVDLNYFSNLFESTSYPQTKSRTSGRTR